MTESRKIYIAVIGAGLCDAEASDRAKQVGRAIAKLGGVLVCGALGGIMEAAAEGAKEKDGVTIGILPGNDKSSANRFIDYVIPTGIGESRNLVIIRTADAVVALPGKYGTLSEIAFCLKLNKPLVSMSNWDISDEIEKFDNPTEAVTRAFELVRNNRSENK